jgi:sugar lactone lactonase YvrE
MEYQGKAGFADGIRADVDGNIWASAGWVGDGYDGVHIFAPNGERIVLIKLPEICSNVCFGGSKRRYCFFGANQSRMVNCVPPSAAAQHFEARVKPQQSSARQKDRVNG